MVDLDLTPTGDLAFKIASQEDFLIFALRVGLVEITEDEDRRPMTVPAEGVSIDFIKNITSVEAVPDPRNPDGPALEPAEMAGPHVNVRTGVENAERIRDIFAAQALATRATLSARLKTRYTDAIERDYSVMDGTVTLIEPAPANPKRVWT